ncbi:MAG: protein translocase subunit SecD [Gammaproteobacteria bacterium]
MNHYPNWKNILIAMIVVVGILYALPNLYGEDPAVQVSQEKADITAGTAQGLIETRLKDAGLTFKPLEARDERLLVRMTSYEDQQRAKQIIRDTLGDGYHVALNLAPNTPGWLRSINALPMFLGLDLRGGVHFQMEVDMETALENSLERYQDDIRTTLRKKKIRYSRLRIDGDSVEVRLKSAADLGVAEDVLGSAFAVLDITSSDRDREFVLKAKMTEDEVREVKEFAIQQNITTLRNRVNELGVMEPIIQRQGEDRIVVQLPGVQDTAEAKRILGATATLEYRAVDTEHDVAEAVAGRVPAGSRLYRERDGKPILLKKKKIATGDQIINARSGFDNQTGGPQVSVTLDGQGAKNMLKFTKKSVGKPMAVVFIENRSKTQMVDGQEKITSYKVEEVISVATIRGVFGKQFQTTGLDSPREAHNLALLLRSGALAAPVRIVEERTVGPSLGKDNIDKGFRAVVIGFVLVLIFMAIYYKVFGLVADVALALNLILLVALLSMLQATLTLPGIAGIVLTVGMAVDANVLIFERIREEIRNGSSPQASIQAGYEKAFSTIIDANITTLIAAIVLFSFGTGPIKGFAVTLSLGIITSMFTAILGTRAVINLLYGGRRLEKLAI